MPSHTELTKKIICKEFYLFTGFFLIITTKTVAGNDAHCSSETLYFGNEKIPITWPEADVSNKQISSDCLYDAKQLLPRICADGGWTPSLEVIKSLCVYHQPSYADQGNCPPGYKESKTGDVCYQVIIAEPWKELCLHTSGSTLSFLDLKSDEQYDILEKLSPLITNVGLPATGNKWPSKQISSDIGFRTEEVDLQWLLPGKYGSILRLSAAVMCSGYKNVCNDMCLTMNATQSTAREPISLIVEECSNINSVLCVSRKNSFIRNVGCSASGYYRVGYSANNVLSYSIKIFEQPLHITEQSGMILQLSCEANKIFHMERLEDLIIYRQLASVIGLERHHRCLFGLTSLNTVIRYTDWTDWNESVITSINFTNWDKSVDYSPILTRSDSYLTVNSDGYWLWEENATCIVCAMYDPPPQTKLSLQFNTKDSALILEVTDQGSLWRENYSQNGFLCFALITYNFTDEYKEVPVQSTSSSDLFLLANVGNGIYWCSGHLIQTLDFVRSDLTYVGMVFAFHVNFNCHEECAEPGEDQTIFRTFLDSNINESFMEIKGLQYIDHAGQVKVFHVTLLVHEEISHHNEYNDIGLSVDQLYTYYALKELRQLQQIEEPAFYILSVTSTEFCLPDSIESKDFLNWKAANVGETVQLTEMCFKFTRSCSRNGFNGATWNEYSFQFICNNQSQIFHSLVEMYDNFLSSEQIPGVIFNLSTTLRNVTLNEADLFVVSGIFGKVSNFLSSDDIELKFHDLKLVIDIIDKLMLVSQEVAKASSQLNSTNSLLASFDKILTKEAHTLTHHDSTSGGVVSVKSELVACYILDPAVSGYSGIAILKNNATTNRGFRSYKVNWLQSNQSVDAISRKENLILASFVPQKLIETWENPIMVFTLFHNDVLFQSHCDHFVADGIIISLTILNSYSTFPTSIPFFFKPNETISRTSNDSLSQFCGYWDLSESKWNLEGCLLNKEYLEISGTILCECSHLTHFGNLVNTKIIFSEIDEKILNLITLVGCALSLVGIIGIFLTAILFSSWRSKTSSKFLLQLSASIAFQMILLIFINSNDDMLVTFSQNLYGCIVIGSLIHYSILAMFFWMLIVAYLQFIRYVIVFNQIATSKFLLKSSIFGWGMPALPVFIVLAVNPTSYIPRSNVKFCYPSGYGIIFGLLVPLIAIVVVNMFVFIAVVASLIQSFSKSAACKVNNKNEAIWSQLRLSVFLFFVLGFSWIFAFLSNQDVRFSYLFCLTATLQGFVLFFYFVVLDPVARNLWKRLFMKIFCCKKF